MLNENENNLILMEDTELEKAIDDSLVTLPVDEAQSKLIDRIIDAPNKEELQHQFDLFNLTQSKKNALRIIKLNTLLDKVEDQAIERFEKRPDQVSNKEILDYLQVVSNQIDKAQTRVDELKDKPTIRVATQNNQLNINVGPTLDRDSKERVVDAITALLKQIDKNNNNDTSLNNMEEVEFVNTSSNESEEELPEIHITKINTELNTED